MTTTHVFARLTGHGYSLLPVTAPFRLARVEGELPMVQISVGEEDDAKAAVVVLDENALRYSLAPGTDTLEEVVHATASPVRGPFRIETPAFHVGWPEGFAIHSPEGDVPTPFDLRGPDGSLLFLQGPYPSVQVPRPADLLTPGQRLLRVGDTAGHPWAEFAADHDGDAWVQRQYLLRVAPDRVLLLSSQAPERHAELVACAADDLATTFAPGPAR